LKGSCPMMFELLLDVNGPFPGPEKHQRWFQSSNRCAHPREITPYPTGRLFRGDAFPGTSCQATIAPSLRDKSQLAYW